MKPGFTEGTSVTRTFSVNKPRTIDFMGEDCRVYATPSLVRDIEQTCRDMIFEQADDGEDSVGFKISLVHTAPTLLGMDVAVTATVTGIEGSKIAFEVSASDPVDQICSGVHERFVVETEKTRKRLESKAAKAGQT